MAKPDKKQPPKQETAPQENKNDSKKKQMLEVPPLVDMTITFSRSAFILISILVALVSFGSGSDLQTVFVRTLIAMIVTGLLMWLISWWITEQFFESQIKESAARSEMKDENMLKDVKA